MAKSHVIPTREALSNLFAKLNRYGFEKPIEIVVKEYKSTRSVEQNARLWATLTDLSDQVEWHGEKLSKEDWKTMITASLKGQKARAGIDGNVVVFGQPTSKMTIEQMTDVIEAAHAFGAEHDVIWGDTE